MISDEVDFIKAPASQFDTILKTRKPVSLNAHLAERFHVDASLESGLVLTYFNMSDPRIGIHPDPERNQRNHALRCAIVKGFDWDRRNEIFYYGLGQVFPGIIPPVTPEFQTDQDTITSPATWKAPAACLLLNGWNESNLPELEYGLTSSVTGRQMFEQFRSFMIEIGYPAEKIQAH